MSTIPRPTDSQYYPLACTPVGVDVGVKNLIAAAPAGGDVESAFTIEGSHIQTRHEILVESMRALQGAKFDSTEGQAQLFAAIWYQIRPQVYDAAVRVVRYAQQFTTPIIVLEDLPYYDVPLWERRMNSDAGAWLLPALQHAIVTKAHEVGIPATYVDPDYTTQECHLCGDLGDVAENTVECISDDCPVDRVSRDRSAALTIAKRGEVTSR
ncbi:IS200/IS605 family accessory protein TnpB-related protein [Haloferax gibbonsii]|uniref:Transposase n=1 Tax=Haloferax gibbonsii TaxID=35746 RepID=A0A0K1J024_HALGI|nr:zinc ribbon domain-containing protein [Haloferax gibbonsii]AKU09893.1 transposase [Haloferax gibbonsii]